jgi:hypothetical protein
MVSCVAAITSGATAGLHLQFDVGSVIGDPLATGVESFVGLNIVALGLVMVLAGYDLMLGPQPTHYFPKRAPFAVHQQPNPIDAGGGPDGEGTG